MLLTEYDPARVLEIARKNSYEEGRKDGCDTERSRLFQLLLRMSEKGEVADIQEERDRKSLEVNEKLRMYR